MNSDRQPGRGAQRGRRPNAQRKYHDVGFDCVAGNRCDGTYSATLGVGARDDGIGQDGDACGAHTFFDAVAHLRVELAHHPGARGESGLESALRQRLCHLHADVAATDHDSSTAGAGNQIEPIPRVLKGLRRIDTVDQRSVRVTRPVRDHRRGTGAQDELVVGDLRRLVELRRHRDDLPITVDSGDRRSHAEVDAEFPVLRGAARNEISVGVDEACDEVRNAACRVRRIRRLLERDHLDAAPGDLCCPKCLMSGTHTGGVRANDDDAFHPRHATRVRRSAAPARVRDRRPRPYP
ncbi:Uncharacterised protein [Mycobacteroides abscessus subsp. abscessus]|nr:Uncharacterised protein [Mycobacteroides abscessus subsp. abscessus]